MWSTLAPPIWPKLAIFVVTALNGATWAAVWTGWLGRDWGLWATSGGAVIAFITIMLWRDAAAAPAG